MPRPPSSFHGFIGQRAVVAHLREQLAGARVQGDPCPSILLIGPSGVGKTQLARAMASEIGTNLLVGHGQEALADLAERILGARTGDIVFVDEAHNATAKVQEMLFHVIDESTLPAWAVTPKAAAGLPSPPSAAAVVATSTAVPGVGGGNSGSAGGPAGGVTASVKATHLATEVAVAVPRITLVLATDQPGRLVAALFKRMELVEHLEPYPQREMQAIVDRVASDLGLLLSGQARNHLARISQGMPRLAKHYLRSLRRHAAATGRDTVGLADARRFLRSFGVDRRGLRREHRKVIRFLDRVGSASLETIGRMLGVDVRYVARDVESTLVRLGLIHICSGGRRLTKAGRAYRSKLRRRQRRRPSGAELLRETNGNSEHGFDQGRPATH